MNYKLYKKNTVHSGYLILITVRFLSNERLLEEKEHLDSMVFNLISLILLSLLAGDSKTASGTTEVPLKKAWSPHTAPWAAHCFIW